MSSLRIILFWESMFLRDVIFALLERDEQILIGNYCHTISEEMILTHMPSHILMEAGVVWQENWLPHLLQQFENIVIIRLDMQQNQVHIFHHQSNTLTHFSDFIEILESSSN